MADQKVTIANPNDSGSPSRVAWEMAKFLRTLVPDAADKADKIKGFLDLYADCFAAASGWRDRTNR